LADKKRFLLRLDPELYRRLEKWAADELRSVNAQIEYLLRDALVRGGRTDSGQPPGSKKSLQSRREPGQ
jgi:hypothetical protein